jgi:hypothetical protein
MVNDKLDPIAVVKGGKSVKFADFMKLAAASAPAEAAPAAAAPAGSMKEEPKK